MGHAIYIDRFPTKMSKTQILKLCNRVAVQEGDYHTELDGIRFNDKVLGNHEEAQKWIAEHDNGWYDNLAIRYKEGRRTFWLVKYEFHV